MDRRLAAILSADAVGYTRLMGDDELATVRTITAYRSEIAGQITARRGRVVDSPGDNLLAELPSVLDAVEAAIAVQEALARANAALPERRRMPFRIGVHLGDLMADGERIYGEGINITARLQALAPPGGLLVSAAVHEQVRGKLGRSFEDAGEQRAKGVSYPVGAFRLPAPVVPEDEVGRPQNTERPAIAVLPFENLSPEPEQAFLADAIAGDLVPLLSAWRSFPVIARNSSFTYRDRTVDPMQVHRELGARYVVSGSVRVAGARVRVSAELADAETGKTLWAEKYDRRLAEIFELQDEVTQSIVAALQPALRDAEAERARARPPESLQAWALVNRAWIELQTALSDGAVRERTVESAARALEMDPDYALGYAVRAFARALIVSDMLGPERVTRQDEILEEVRRATALAPDDPRGAARRSGLARARPHTDGLDDVGDCALTARTSRRGTPGPCRVPEARAQHHVDAAPNVDPLLHTEPGRRGALRTRARVGWLPGRARRFRVT